MELFIHVDFSFVSFLHPLCSPLLLLGRKHWNKEHQEVILFRRRGQRVCWRAAHFQFMRKVNPTFRGLFALNICRLKKKKIQNRTNNLSLTRCVCVSHQSDPAPRHCFILPLQKAEHSRSDNSLMQCRVLKKIHWKINKKK